MWLILLSLFFTLLFGFVSIMILNLSIYLWESQRVDNLTSRIKSEESTILDKSSASRGYNTPSLGYNLHKSLNGASSAYQRTILNIQEKEYPSWLKKLIFEFENFRKYSFQSLKRFWRYLLNLTKPTGYKNNDVDKTEIKQKIEQEEIDNFVDKVVAENEEKIEQEEETKKNQPKEDVMDIVEVEETEEKDQQKDSGDDKDDDESLATLSFAGSTNISTNAKTTDSNIFEKLENRILSKLKDHGMHHYDIWLELGMLYEKYDEIEKAKEVYALVMKQSNGKEKELARDRLIGIS